MHALYTIASGKVRGEPALLMAEHFRIESTKTFRLFAAPTPGGEWSELCADLEPTALVFFGLVKTTG